MSFDSKIRNSLSQLRIATNPKAQALEKPKPAEAKALATPPQPFAQSSFDNGPKRVGGKLAEGRAEVGVAADTAEGRRKRDGIADDSVGRRRRDGIADDSVGRRKRDGIADDSVGRRKRDGIADDSVGVGDPAGRRTRPGGVADDSVGVTDPAGKRTRKGGVADDSIGTGDPTGKRTRKGGVADDSIGTGDPTGKRTRKGGVADDSIGDGNAIADAYRDSLVGPVEDPAQLALQRSVYERMETPSYLFNPASGHAKALGNNAKAVGDAMGAQVANALLQLSDKDRNVAQRMDDIIQGTTSAPAGTREALLRTLSADPKGNTGLITAKIAGSREFAKLPGPVQFATAQAMTHMDERGLRLLGAMLEQAPEALSQVDSEGMTFAANLQQLATQPLNSALAGKTTTADLLSSTLLDVTNPNRIDQGTAPTCTVTSMQFELAVEAPAEYLRLMTGLTGATGSVRMKGGGELTLGAEDADSKARDGRSISQALFQSAAMEYANGRDTDFDPIKGQSTNRVNGDTYGGLKPAQQTQILRGLFGVTYRTDTFYKEADGAKALAQLKHFDSGAHVNRPVILDIDQGPINHAVTLEKIDGGKVYFRDPYGALRSIPEDAFPKYVVAMHRPSDLFPN